MSDFSEQEKKEKQRAYMRDYMRRRYHSSPTEERIYRNTIRIQKQSNIDDEDRFTFGKYLANAVKIKKMVKELPPELAQQLIDQLVDR